MRGAVAAAALLGACEKPPAPPDADPPALPPPPPSCRPEPAGTPVATWPGRDGCPMVLLARGAALHLESLALEPRAPADGPAPVCRVAACRYEGADTELGPMVLAIEPGAESEVPRAVTLGVVTGRSLVFFDLWAGAGSSVIEDSTALGPAHALAPMRCGDELGLFAQPRVAEAAGLEVPPQLRAREGLLALDRDDAVLRAGSSAGCRPIPLPLP